MRYLILRQKDVHKVPAGHVPAGVDGSVEAFSQDLPPSEVRGLRRDKRVLNSAPAMSLALIRPINAEQFMPVAATGAKQEKPTWGVRAVKADTSGFSAEGVCVALLDTGIDKAHHALAGIKLGARNCRNFTTTDSSAWHDTDGHGTHCAGTIFGRPVSGNRIGVAPGVNDVVIGKVLGSDGGSTGTLLDALNWAIQNEAQIISMSLGMDLVGLREQLVEDGVHELEATSTAMRVLIDNVRLFDKFGNLLRSGIAFGRSAAVIAASGNESDRMGARFGGLPFVLGAAYPSETEDFVSVGALGRHRRQ